MHVSMRAWQNDAPLQNRKHTIGKETMGVTPEKFSDMPNIVVNYNDVWAAKTERLLSLLIIQRASLSTKVKEQRSTLWETAKIKEWFHYQETRSWTPICESNGETGLLCGISTNSIPSENQTKSQHTIKNLPIMVNKRNFKLTCSKYSADFTDSKMHLNMWQTFAVRWTQTQAATKCKQNSARKRKRS